MGTSVSAIIQVTTPAAGAPPVAPTGLVVSNLAATSLTLSWTASASGTPPITYQPQRALASAPTVFANVGVAIAGTTVNDTGLQSFTNYLYRVIAINSGGTATSASLAAQTLALLPGAPTGLAVQGAPLSTSVAFSWTAPATGTPPFSYQMLSRTPSGVGSFTPIGAATNGTSITVTGLTPSTSYDFEVTATNLIGTGPASTPLLNVVTAASGTTVLPSAPTNLAATPASTSMAVTWSAPAVGTPPLTYTLQYRPTPSGLPGDLTGTTAFRIADMMERFGAITYSQIGGTNVWGAAPSDFNVASATAALQFITGSSGMTMQCREYHGATNNALQLSWCTQIQSATGAIFSMAFDMLATDADVASQAALALSSSTSTGWLHWVEGANEPNGSGTSIPTATCLQMQVDVFAGANATTGNAFPVTSAEASLVFALPNPEQIAPMGNYFTTADRATFNSKALLGNVHFYPPDSSDVDDGSGRGGAFNDVFQGFGTYTGNKPLMITEWHPTLFNMHGHNNDPVYDAYYTPCFFLSAFRLNFVAWFWFALLDYGNTFATGLFPRSGTDTPRAVAQTVRAMYVLTGDTGSGKHTFTPQKLNFTVSNLQPPIAGSPNTGGQTMLFQNSTTGTFFLYVWNSQSDPGGVARTVTIAFNSHQMTNVKDYKISDASSASAPTTVLQNLNNVSSMTIALDASVHLLVITY